MARKDDILKSFLAHRMLKEKYEISVDDMPKTIREATNSNIPIIKAIALIVDNLENSTPISDPQLRILVTQYLNESAL